MTQPIQPIGRPSKKVMSFLANNFFTSERTQPTVKPSKKVIVIDSFKNKTIDIDRDGINDMSHGKVVSRCITAENKDVFVKEKNVDIKGEEALSLGKIKRKLSGVVRNLNLGSKIEGVNLSISNSISFEGLSYSTGVEGLTAENIKDKKEEVRDSYRQVNEVKYKDLKSMEDLEEEGISFDISRKDFKKVKSQNRKFVKVIDNIEKITEKGVPVYIAAGNDGKDYYNLNCLAEGSTSVGATDPVGNIVYFSAQNSDVNKYEQGQFITFPVFDDGKKVELTEISIVDGSVKRDSKVIGYDINFDGKADIEASELSLQDENPKIGMFEGTSFASPTALAKELKEIKE